MSCKKCQQKKPCTTTNDCACEVYLTSDCVNNVKTEFECLEIATGLSLTETLKAMDEQFCVKFDTITNYFTIINVGTGEDVYKGVNNLGQKELKRIVKEGDLITVSSDENTIFIGLDEEALNTFIETNQKTVVVSNAGTIGETLVKTAEVSGDETTYPIKRLIYSYPETGGGESFLRDLQVNTDDITIRGKKAVSDTITITSTDEEVRFEISTLNSIPSLYVNNSYSPTYEEWLAENTNQNGGTPVLGFSYIGKGTLAQPFTDTTVYTLSEPSTLPVVTPDSAIQNALDGDTVYSYVGNGTRLNPQRHGQQVTVQYSLSGYQYGGNFSYTGLFLKIEASINATTTDYFLDMDNPSYFDSTTSYITILIDKDSNLNFTNSLGIKNSGNSVNVDTYSSGRTYFLKGEGRLSFSYNGADVLSRYIFNGDGNNNDGNLHGEIRCKVEALYQGVYDSKSKNKLDFYSDITSGFFLGVANPDLKAFNMSGGQIRFFQNSLLSISSGGRTYGLTFEPSGEGVGYCSFSMFSGTIGYNCRYLFSKLNNEHVDIEVRNCLGGGATVFPFGSNTVVKGLFENTGVSKWQVDFKNNNFVFTGIDFTKVDLTKGNTLSCINFIGNNVVQRLVTFSSRADAIANGIEQGSSFLNKKTVTAGSFVVGAEYQILTVGTTDFTLIGAASNTVGLYFTATGTPFTLVGTGTGTAYSYTVDTLI